VCLPLSATRIGSPHGADEVDMASLADRKDTDQRGIEGREQKLGSGTQVDQMEVDDLTRPGESRRVDSRVG
jgi:hypothetical protein